MSSSPPVHDLPEPLSVLIGQMMHLIHRRSAGDTLALMNESGLTMTQLVALYSLYHGGALTVSELGEVLRLSAAATSHLVNRLVTAGLVDRCEDVQDRRQKRITITPSGLRLVERIQEERVKEFSQVVGRLSPALRSQFEEVVRRVIEELSDGTPEGVCGRTPSFVPKERV